MSEFTPPPNGEPSQSHATCQKDPEAILRAQVHWLGDTFADSRIRHFADDPAASTELLAEYLARFEGFQTGVWFDPYVLLQPEQGPERLPVISLGSTALALSPSAGEQDAA